MDDQTSDRQAIIKEKDQLLTEYVQLKSFIPEFEKMDKANNKIRFLVEMKERCSKDEFLSYLYQYAFVQQGRIDEMQKRIDGL